MNLSLNFRARNSYELVIKIPINAHKSQQTDAFLSLDKLQKQMELLRFI